MIRSFYLTSLALLLFTVSNAQVNVNQQRIEKRITELAQFGKDANGKGYRVAYTKGDIEGRNYFMGLMRNAGLEVSIDNAGNIIGKRKGKNPLLKPLAFGSHLDMVPDGGNYDGCLGSIAALELMEVLKENKIITQHPLELIIFSNEEGGTDGSAAMAGNFSPDALKLKTQSGLTIGEGVKAIGGNPDHIKDAALNKGDLAAFVELHIEQGGLLEKEKLQIGVVEGIVGIEHWEVTVEGFANHAGTTPMNMRSDALLAAAKFIVAVNEEITKVAGRQVGTVGKIAAMPGAFNVIPGKVNLGLEIRDLNYEKIWKLFKSIEQRAKEIEATSGTHFTFEYQNNASKPALTAKIIQDKIVGAAKSLGLSYQYMQSGAGHDAQEISTIAPVGMIFVPSVGGISHSPKEFTKGIDMANGANVLLKTILALDQQ
ncbi:MAG: M20 family metallo-hydrolase [Bacteroidetes bacterium]|nr:M20 family metallo-hydrolase [Bacteroidota bacterium]MBU1485987.1 M20 family metallo-hydrolase [Bacteroidota bacterium]MBU2045918.1 M20 family metallo-hydrolase [Bacteroidota bacterium]MBU2269070.1 M20 family metallo-hydrolase [Bacteroidota bacterium]MBU2375609.1 M20 family metallo-hydrolase [Bacteroidota bacterium]